MILGAEDGRLRSWLRAVLVLAVLVVFAFRFLNYASAKVAFMGDSLTRGWAFPRVNFGVKGQTTAEMVDRFPAEVCWKGYQQVVIMGGTNDTLLGVDPEVTLKNLDLMVEMARAAGVKPVMAEIPPIYAEGGKFLPAVQRLDAGIVKLAGEEKVPVADYYDAIAGHPELLGDGIHTGKRGYLRMEWALLKVDMVF
jgi:lysophospholipase L1-like esterase